MKNKEYYENFLARYDHNVCDDNAPWHEDICRGHSCVGCIKRLLDWLDCEKEIVTPVEREFLSIVDSHYNYIARDARGQLYLFENEPKKTDSGDFTYPDGWVYRAPYFINDEFSGVKAGECFNIAQC